MRSSCSASRPISSPLRSAIRTERSPSATREASTSMARSRRTSRRMSTRPANAEAAIATGKRKSDSRGSRNPMAPRGRIRRTTRTSPTGRPFRTTSRRASVSMRPRSPRSRGPGAGTRRREESGPALSRNVRPRKRPGGELCTVPSEARKRIQAGRTDSRCRSSKVSTSAGVGAAGDEAMAVATAVAASSARAFASRTSRGWRTAEATSAWSSVPMIAVRRKIAAIVQKRLRLCGGLTRYRRTGTPRPRPSGGSADWRDRSRACGARG